MIGQCEKMIRYCQNVDQALSKDDHMIRSNWKPDEATEKKKKTVEEFEKKKRSGEEKKNSLEVILEKLFFRCDISIS